MHIMATKHKSAQQKIDTTVNGNGHYETPVIDIETMRAKEVESAPWAGDETLDYTKLKAPDFLKTPTQKTPTRTKVTCRNLHNQEFVRRYECEQAAIPFRVIRDRNNRGTYYIVPDELSDLLAKFWVYANIELVITQDGDLIFVVAPFSDSRGNANDYWITLREILAEATHRWVKVLANTHANKYEPDYPVIELADPDWPEIDWGKLFGEAFKGKVLSHQHPAMRGLVGGKR
jgi:hypothetical protein